MNCWCAKVQDNNRMYRGLESETEQELRDRLKRISASIREKIQKARACQENHYLRCIVPQYRAEIIGHQRAREKIKRILAERKK